MFCVCGPEDRTQRLKHTKQGSAADPHPPSCVLGTFSKASCLLFCFLSLFQGTENFFRGLMLMTYFTHISHTISVASSPFCCCSAKADLAVRKQMRRSVLRLLFTKICGWYMDYNLMVNIYLLSHFTYTCFYGEWIDRLYNLENKNDVN